MPRFTHGELNVMKILWEHGDLKPSDIQRRFREPIKNPALRSYLKILLDKGHVVRRKVGRAYVYRAVTPRKSAFRETLGELIDTYFRGSRQALLMSLLKAEKLSDRQLLELKRLAEDKSE
jgi:predicted transcriptional regulator